MIRYVNRTILTWTLSLAPPPACFKQETRDGLSFTFTLELTLEDNIIKLPNISASIP